MPSELAISVGGGGSTLAAGPTLKSAVAAMPAISVRGGDPRAMVFPLPVEHLVAALGIEVMQFVDHHGDVTQSFPTQRQLDAYRDAPPIFTTVPAALPQVVAQTVAQTVARTGLQSGAQSVAGGADIKGFW
jgi:hypothetical protein